MYLFILLEDTTQKLEEEYGSIFIFKDKGGENMRKYICILLISLMLTIGANAVSISAHSIMPPRQTEICTYIGIPMAEEDGNTDDTEDDDSKDDGNTDDTEDDDSKEDDNYNPNPCDLIKFPEAMVDYIVVPNQNIDNIYMSEIKSYDYWRDYIKCGDAFLFFPKVKWVANLAGSR